MMCSSLLTYELVPSPDRDDLIQAHSTSQVERALSLESNSLNQHSLLAETEYSCTLPNRSEPKFLQLSNVRIWNLCDIYLVSVQTEALWLQPPSILLVRHWGRLLSSLHGLLSLVVTAPWWWSRASSSEKQGLWFCCQPCCLLPLCLG